MSTTLLRLTAIALLAFASTVAARPIIGLTSINQLVHIDSETPGTITKFVPIVGLQTGDSVESIDFRPSNGILYALATNPTGATNVSDYSRIYTVNPETGVATLVGAISASDAPSSGVAFGFDFNPVSGLLRLVNEDDRNIPVSADSGTSTANNTNLSYSNGDPEQIVAAAYDRNDTSAATATTLYGIDFANKRLVRIGGVDGSPSPAGGLVVAINTLSVAMDSKECGFDIADDGTAYVTIGSGAPVVYRLYKLNLANGALTQVGTFGFGSAPIRGLAVPFTAPPTPSFVVRNKDASGAESLRETIARANAHPGLDTITFDIPGAPPHVIQPSAGINLPALPPLYDPVTIDARTEPDFNAETRAPVVVLDGGGSNVSNLKLPGKFANGSTIAGLRITGHVDISFPPNFGALEINSDNVKILGNYIGTDGANHNEALANSIGIFVRLGTIGTRIGGTTLGERNVISRNQKNIRIEGGGTQVVGNFIGSTAAGTEFLPFAGTGVEVVGLGGDNTTQIGGTVPGSGNVISSSHPAILISKSRRNVVAGNLIGTDSTGTQMAAITFGISLQDSDLNTIGGTTSAARNVIAGFSDTGIFLLNSSNNFIRGNYIGTDITGEVALRSPSSNVGTGISCVACNYNQIGGDEPGAGNVISGARLSGIDARNLSQGNMVRGNLIGVSVSGAALGNGQHGIRLEGGSVENIIGTPGAGNVIAFNGANGVALVGENTDLNPIRGNSIYSNGQLGIDLQNEGVTPNDNGDGDSGANENQNFPILSSAKTSIDGTTTVQGSLSSNPNTTFNIDFYASDAADPSGHGEGRSYLGTTSASTDANGSVTFQATFPAVAGNVLSATASTAGSIANTSEFSAAISIIGPVPARLANISTRLRVGTGDNVLIGGFIVSGNDPKKVIVRAIGPSSGVGSSLADPALEIYNAASELVASNDNWRDNANQQEIADSKVAPPDDSEAAFLGSLAPGAYTAVMYGVGDTTGIGLVELYDLDAAANSQLANIATRGFVQTGDDVLIGGFIITGETQLKLLVRGIGPSVGIQGRLADPTLELFNANGDSLAFNNNWRDTQEAEITATSIPPSDDLEAAIVTQLAPASYTAVLRGVNDTTGVGVVEVYAVK